MRKMRCLKISLLLGAALVIGGCSSDVFKKVDREVAGWFGESCSFTNLSSGDDFCMPEKEAHMQPLVYCYKTLGSVNCYAEENPYHTERSVRVRKVPALASSIENDSQVMEFAPVQFDKSDPTVKE